jgi:hypothetical protein
MNIQMNFIIIHENIQKKTIVELYSILYSHFQVKV